MVATKFTETSGRPKLAASHRQLKGYLINSDGQTVKEMSTGKSDRVSQKEVLSLAIIDALIVHKYI